MALEVFFAPKALQDLQNIGDFIAKDNPERARTWVSMLEEHCQSLAEHPFRAPARDDLRPGYRVMTVGAYLIFYRVVGDTVLISRVLQGARHVGRAFDDDKREVVSDYADSAPNWITGLPWQCN